MNQIKIHLERDQELLITTGYKYGINFYCRIGLMKNSSKSKRIRLSMRRIKMISKNLNGMIDDFIYNNYGDKK